jgi:hypothetical protein
MQKPIIIHKDIVYIPNELLEINCEQSLVNRSGFGTNGWFLIYTLIPLLFLTAFFGQSFLVFGLAIIASIFAYFKYSPRKDIPKKFTLLKKEKSIITTYFFSGKVQKAYRHVASLDFKVQISHQKAVIILFDYQFELIDATKVPKVIDAIAKLWDLTFFYAFTLNDGTEVLNYSASKAVSPKLFKVLKIKNNYKFCSATDKLDYFSINQKNGQIMVFFTDKNNYKQRQIHTHYDTILMTIQQVERTEYMFTVAINFPNKEQVILMEIEYADELQIRKDEELCCRRIYRIVGKKNMTIVRKKEMNY